jgi:hypothetical protein
MLEWGQSGWVEKKTYLKNWTERKMDECECEGEKKKNEEEKTSGGAEVDFGRLTQPPLHPAYLHTSGFIHRGKQEDSRYLSSTLPLGSYRAIQSACGDQL